MPVRPSKAFSGIDVSWLLAKELFVMPWTPNHEAEGRRGWQKDRR